MVTPEKQSQPKENTFKKKPHIHKHPRSGTCSDRLQRPIGKILRPIHSKSKKSEAENSDSYQYGTRSVLKKMHSVFLTRHFSPGANLSHSALAVRLLLRLFEPVVNSGCFAPSTNTVAKVAQELVQVPRRLQS
jgi:hypothetical protein|nr:hypothetical protein [Stenotrophomonas koreensis]